MKIVVDVKRSTKTTNFKDGDTLLYDASDKQWFIVNKDELFHRYDEQLNRAIEEMDEKYKKFLTDYTIQNEKLLKVIEAVVKTQKGEN